MYAAEVEGKQLNFAVSGMLWKRSLVMRDDETDSLWSHILGKCMKGELKGTTLEIHPSSLTDWKSWKTMYPRTTAVVMSKTSKDFKNDLYQEPEKFVVGLGTGAKARAWNYQQMLEQPIVNDFWQGQPVVVNLATPSYSTTIFSREVDGRVHTFALQENSIVDQETNSSWDMQKGIATNGPLQGTRLLRLQSVPSFAKTWKEFHPDSTYWDPSQPILLPDSDSAGAKEESDASPETHGKGPEDEQPARSNFWWIVLAIGLPSLIGFGIYFRVSK